MEVRNVPPSEIRPYDRNPRNNDAAVGPVSESIRRFGFRQPIVVDQEGVIIVGHTRHRAALSLGLDSVPVVVADNLTPEQCAQYRLVDNKVGELSEWDENALGEELAGLLDARMEDFGFEGFVDMEGFGEDFTLPDDDEPKQKAVTLNMSEELRDMLLEATASLDSVRFSEASDLTNRTVEIMARWLEDRGIEP